MHNTVYFWCLLALMGGYIFAGTGPLEAFGTVSFWCAAALAALIVPLALAFWVNNAKDGMRFRLGTVGVGPSNGAVVGEIVRVKAGSDHPIGVVESEGPSPGEVTVLMFPSWLL